MKELTRERKCKVRERERVKILEMVKKLLINENDNNKRQVKGCRK